MPGYIPEANTCLSYWEVAGTESHFLYRAEVELMATILRLIRGEVLSCT